MKNDQLYEIWKAEEAIAHIKGWDFSHIEGRTHRFFLIARKPE